METWTILFVSIILLYVQQGSFSSEASSLQSNFYLHENASDLKDFTENLSLLRCPGSRIEAVHLHNISKEDSRKYGFYEVVGEGAGNATIMPRFIEGAPDCPSEQLEISSDEHKLHEHGWLLKVHNDKFRESISPSRYCLSDFENEINFTVQFCRSDVGSQPRISKCCSANEVCDLGASDEHCSCVDSGPIKWTTTVSALSNISFSFVHHLFNSCDHVHYTLNENSRNLNFEYKNEFKIDENGHVQFRRLFDGTWFTPPEGTYCVDGAVQSSYPEESPSFSGDLSDMVLFMCRNNRHSSKEESDDQHDLILYGILMPFSTAVIGLTIAVYVLTWSEQNAHGYSMFFYLVSLVFLYIFIVLSNMPSIAHPANHPIFCGFIAGAIHFSYLSSTCWLTSISFDVFRTFQKMHGSRSKGLRRFTIYSVFSFGYPIVQVTVCAVLDALYREAPPNEVRFILPNYGYGGVGCNMSNDGVTFYLFVPISILLFCNTGFFIATIVIMKLYKRSIREAFSGIDKCASSKVNQSFGIYTRLFIIMGIFWITQIISWFVLIKFSHSPEPRSLQIIFAITDALTVLQSVVIFYIFVCKRNVFINLWNLRPWLRPFLSLLISGGCCAIPNRGSQTVTSRPNSGNTNVSSVTTTKGSLKSRKGSAENCTSSTSELHLETTVVSQNSNAEVNGTRKISTTSRNSLKSAKSDIDMNGDIATCRTSVQFSTEGKAIDIEKTAETNV